MFITFRLEADQNIYKIAKATGTSLTQIEKTYSHLLAEQASREIQQVRNRETPASDEAIKKKKVKKSVVAALPPNEKRLETMTR
jgi:hypothetical protein